MSTQWHPHSTVSCVCEKEGLFLMVKETINGKSVYNQPAGHIEDNESIIDAVLRETLEETAHMVSVMNVGGIYRYRVSSNLTFIRFSINCKFISKTNSRIDADIESVHWLSYAEIVNLKHQLRSPLVLKSIDDYKNGITYPLSLIDNNF